MSYFGYSFFNRGFFALHYWGTWPTYPHASADPADSGSGRRYMRRRYFIR